MFYSQFILAKKGPLGTIWIAAHLERKLRKNQVADTDIGVSVDSILFPDVPIALRLSSHLLLGVVRIYSRKVNYLFDDCSEALLKIKQAFRSTAVDLPPEESTAPYHSITLPETFDLDDFELPDNDIFQGNYVDHHVSSREQITLQDTMDGVVYSTSQFGLDERFGDGDTSQIGLDLDEDMLLDKAAASGHGGLDHNPEAPAQSEIHQKGYGSDQEMCETLADVQKIHNMDESLSTSEMFGDGKGPSTPGLLEEPNLFRVQDAVVSEDLMETEYHNSTDLGATEGTETGFSKLGPHGGQMDINDRSLQNSLKNVTVSGMNHDENDCLVDDMATNVKQQGHLTSLRDPKYIGVDDHPSTSLSIMIENKQNSLIPNPSEFLDGTIKSLGSDKVEDAHDGLVMNNGPVMRDLLDQTDMDCLGCRVDEATASPRRSHIVSDLVHSGSKTSGLNCPGSEDHLGDNQTSPKQENLDDMESVKNVEKSNQPVNALTPPNVAFPPESPGRPPAVDTELQASQEPNKTESLMAVGNEPMQPGHMDDLQACASPQGQPDIVALTGELGHATDVSVTVLLKCQNSYPLSKEVQMDELHGQTLLDNQLDSANKSATSDVPELEKLLSVQNQHGGETNTLLMESTPDKDVTTSYGDAGMKSMSGRKRTFTESTLTVQSVNTVESNGLTQSTKVEDLIPDDEDLLSSILVGRRSSVLKMKPTPVTSEAAPTKRLQSAARASVSKRKVIIDDTMVLHGDTIRQQLMNTEDIRRLRKKAPCTCHEILMIQGQFLEGEILQEPVFSGVTADLMIVHSEMFDLSGVNVVDHNTNTAFSEAIDDKRTNIATNVAEECGTQIAELQPADMPIATECDQAEINVGSHDIDDEEKAISDKEPKTCQPDEMDIDGQNTKDEDVANHSVGNGLESTSLADIVSKQNGDTPGIIATQLDVGGITDTGLDSSLLMDVAGTTAAKSDDMFSDTDNELKEDKGNETGVFATEAEEHNFEIRTLVQADGCDIVQDLNTSIETTSVEILPHDNQPSLDNDLAENNGDGVLESTNDDKNLASGVECDDKGSTSTYLLVKDNKVDSMCSVERDLDNKDIPNEENLVGRADSPWSAMNAGVSAQEHSLVDDNGDDVTVEDDTGFLNVEDDQVVDNDDDIPYNEGSHLENSGWSFRTRAVAKYLQTVFDKESLRGANNLSLDKLLAGKTQKEASRMFFETLVLKTRDYIHVEQAKPFDSISIKPRMKLLKSDL